MSRTSLLTAFGGVVLAATLTTGFGWVAAQQGPEAAVGTADVPTDPPKSARTAPEAPKPAQPDADARRATEDRLRILEKLESTIRTQIDESERHIETLVKASGTADHEVRLAVLTQRLTENEAEHNRVKREIIALGAEITIVKKRVADKTPPPPQDPELLEAALNRTKAYRIAKDHLETTQAEFERAAKNTPGDGMIIKELKAKVAEAQKKLEEARKEATAEANESLRLTAAAAAQRHLAQLATEVEVKQEIREALKTECDALQKAITSSALGKMDIQKMRDQLAPQREALARIQREIIVTRAQREGITFTEPAGTDAKLDVVLRELAALRKEVQELKELTKKK